MSEKPPEWAQGNANWQNDTLVKLAERLNTMAKMAIQEKINKIKQHATAEAIRLNHPVMNDLAKKINEIEII